MFKLKQSSATACQKLYVFAIVSLIVGFVLLWIFSLVYPIIPHLAPNILPPSHLALTFFLPRHSFKTSRQSWKSTCFAHLKVSGTSTASAKVVLRLSSFLRELCNVCACVLSEGSEDCKFWLRKKCGYQTSVPAPRHCLRRRTPGCISCS